MKSLKNTLFFLLAAAAALLLTDIYIQGACIIPVAYTEMYDDIGRSRRRNIDYVFFTEGFAIGQLNQYRYIGAPHPREKPDNTIRIALIGDSYIEGFQVFQRHHFATLLEQLLNDAELKATVEVLNFAQAGFDLADFYSQHKILVSQFNADYVVYFISTKDLIPQYRDPLRPNPYIENDSLLISFDYPEFQKEAYELSIPFLQHSGVLNMVNMAANKSAKINTAEILFGKFHKLVAADEIHQNYEYEGKPLEPVVTKILESVKEDDVIIVNRGEDRLPATVLSRINEVPYLDLSLTFERSYREGNNPRTWNVTGQSAGHWNHYGHRVVAEELARFFLEHIGISEDQ